MASGAGTGHLAGMLDVDTMIEQHLAQRHPGRRVDDRALGAQLVMGQDNDLRHADFQKVLKINKLR
jgi:hypothetical protein